MLRIARLLGLNAVFGGSIGFAVAAALGAGFGLTAVTPQSAHACLMTKDGGVLAKTAERDYASLFLKRFGGDTRKRFAALVKEIAPDSDATVELMLGRCTPPHVMLNLSDKPFGPQNDQRAKDNFDKLWRALQTKYSDLLCASDGSSGVAYGTLMKIRSGKELSMEVEFIAHELNARLARTGESAMRLETNSDHPPTCAARGFEHRGKVAAIWG